MFERKVFQEMLKWKEKYAPHYALFLKGARRVGKTTLAEKLGREAYESYILIRFDQADRVVKDLFVNGLRDLDGFFAQLQFEYKTQLHRRKSLIVLDEIQLFPQARQALKTLLEDGRYDYLETGSLAGITKRSKDILIPSEEYTLEVQPLDFEEFLWASEDTFTMPLMREHFANRKPMGALHQGMMRSFSEYMLVGGMPQVVQAFVNGKDFGKADLVILFTKAMYSAAAIENVMCAVGEGTYLMTLQNGAGHEAVLSRFVDVSHVIIGTTEDNGSLLSTGVIHHGGKGVTNIGLASGNDTNILCRIKEAFDSCGFSVRIHDNIQQLIWDKLMTNVSLSVLTAILQSDMSFISRDKSAFEICKKLIEEAVTVAKAMGLSFDLPSVIEKVRSTSENNPGGYTSIMMDIKNGRKTEVDTISGAVVRKAHELGLSVPHHEMAVSLIHALENVSRS